MSEVEYSTSSADIGDRTHDPQKSKENEILESKTNNSSNSEEDEESGSAEDRVVKSKLPAYAHQNVKKQREADKTFSLSLQVIKLKEEIKKCKVQLEALAPVPGLDRNAVEAVLLEADGVDHDLRDVKIVHQAKQLRQLKQAIQKEQRGARNALNSMKSMEVEKARMERELEAAQLQIKKFKSPVDCTTPKNGSEPNYNNHGGLALHTSSKRTVSPHGANQRNFTTWRTKYDDLKIRNDKLLCDMKKLHRALTQEMGVDASTPLVDLLKVYGPNQSTGSVIGDGGKRTRSQQIIVLKAKVKELKLKCALERRRASSISSHPESTNLSEESLASMDAKVVSEIYKQQEHKQKQLDQLIIDNEQYRIRVEHLTGKIKASQSRTHILEQERKENKAKIQALVEKSDTDDKLIDALHAQVLLWKQRTEKAKRAHASDGNNVSVTETIFPSLRSSQSSGVDRRKSIKLHESGKSEISSKQVELAIPVSETARYRQLHVENERLLCVIRELKKQVIQNDNFRSPAIETESCIPRPKKIQECSDIHATKAIEKMRKRFCKNLEAMDLENAKLPEHKRTLSENSLDEGGAQAMKIYTQQGHRIQEAEAKCERHQVLPDGAAHDCDLHQVVLLKKRDLTNGNLEVTNTSNAANKAYNVHWGKPDEENEASEGENQEPIEKPNFGLSGALAKDRVTGNTVNGVVMKWSEPINAGIPQCRWRLYVFKGEASIATLHIYSKSAFLVGRDKTVADILTEHSSCSKQHAVIQFRLFQKENKTGTYISEVRPYILDLQSTNGTFLNGERIESSRYIELREKDLLRFGESTREYVLLRAS
uniref:Uncharacterized protein AlNc14C59G4365 n=1 Tax=Albugo laibachii Nc14 TaxID=890382 RepID=F0WCI5_9STRA|nr:conserved unknown protein putative [Albugo laibachii Nc14]|eukprot:CCA18902.1 conserved unknown protein putative [Albugo laibachii Nc14]